MRYRFYSKKNKKLLWILGIVVFYFVSSNEILKNNVVNLLGVVFVLVIVFLFLKGIFKFIKNIFFKLKFKDKVAGYISTKPLVTETERAFYIELKQYCDAHGYLINLKTRLEDIVRYDKNMDFATLQRFRGQIKSRHVDFLIIDKDLNPVFAIELDDSSHNTAKAQETDEFKNKLFEKIGLTLYRIPATDYMWRTELNKVFA